MFAGALRFRNVVDLPADTVNVLGSLDTAVTLTTPEDIGVLTDDRDTMTRAYRAVFAQARGVAWDPAGTFDEQRGIATTGRRDWIEENLVAVRRGTH